MEASTNSIRLVTVSEEAADKIEAKVVVFPGLKENAVQRTRPASTSRTDDETEVIVVDNGNTIELATDLPDLVTAIWDIFTQAGLGVNYEHLQALQQTTVRPGTDPTKLESNEKRMVRFKLNSKNRFYTIQHSDFSRTGDKFNGKRREAGQPNANSDGEILRLRNAVEKLENMCKKGFTDTVEITHEVSVKVDEVNTSDIDLTEETKTFNKKHIEIAEEMLTGFSNSSQALAKLLKSNIAPERK
ncbi:hypothetical protein CYMTET_22441 [Cymbomonas tetramitiformis]|uniref:Uncharacterized protein n=1 Tax=Cymbomonas tetramitiformis TaxID=36881 RepID=A0AAE0BZD1_9CHLO|nr:hypothetical protein CYMTET_44858 [Cymbomonas tetramitiformis]KAK3269093.1 hypothetical protein CYMTET_22441 [Cymbomonas tetramitiformis]